MKSLLYLSCLITLLTAQALAQQTPASRQAESVLIVGATAHLGNGNAIQNSAIGFNNGKLTYVGSASQVNRNDYKKVLDASGKHVYPGFIAANTTLGLVEIDAVRATDDDSEVGNFLPHIRSLIAYNAESKVVESMRPNGVLLAQVAPRGGRISGTSSVMQLDAWNWEDAVVKADNGIHLNWPPSLTRRREEPDDDQRLKPNENYPKQVDELKIFFADSNIYLQGPRVPKNIPFEAMEGLYTGAQKLYVHANGAREITDAVTAAQEAGIRNVVVVGGDEANGLTDFLKTRNVPVLISYPHRLPEHEDESIKYPFMLAKLLSDGGVLVSINAGEEGGADSNRQARNLPFYAGTCAAYGLEREKAVQLITGNAAKILGIDSFAGTLEIGKDATLFVSEGDALDMRTNRLLHAFIQGRAISLETRQTELWRRYSGKYKRP